MNLAIAGSKSDFLKPNVDRIRASGTVRGKNVTWRHEDLPVPVVVDAIEVALGSDAAKLERIEAHYNRPRPGPRPRP